MLRITLFIFLSIFSLALYAQKVNEADQSIYKFLENKGQWPDHVQYKADVNGGKIWLEEGRILYQFSDYSEFKQAHANFQSDVGDIKIREKLVFADFIGSNKNAETVHNNPTSEYYNYFLGNDQSKWATNVHGYSSIKYRELYNGIDLHFYEKDQKLKYDFKVQPEVDPKQIKIKYYGAKKVKINNKGNLIVDTELGQLQELKPYAYQIKNGKVIDVACSYNLNDRTVQFDLGDYDPSLELVIDPILIFATYSGSTTDNFGMTATYAYTGEAYSGGIVYGNTYPAPAPAWSASTNITVQSTGVTTTDVFVSKYSQDGSQMLWTNFVGGGNNTMGTETVHSLICDTLDNIYLFGATSSGDFPTLNAYQPTHSGGVGVSFINNGVDFTNSGLGTDIYVTKISADGLNLMGSTYMGGSNNDGVNYLSGSLPYSNPSLYDSLTTNYGDQFRGEIMLDSANHVIVTSSTRSSDFPTLNAFQNTHGGLTDAVIFKLSSDLSTLDFSSYYGGSNQDAGYSAKVDSSGNILFAGGTSSSGLQGMNGHQTSYNGGECDGFVLKLPPTGFNIDYGSYVGTNAYDQSYFVEIDRANNVYLVGQSRGNMPVSSGVYSNPNSGQFMWRMDPQLATITKSTVFGNGSGNINISPSAFLVDVCGNLYVSGWGANILQTTPMSGMPVTSDAFQSTPANGFDFYLFVLEREMNSLLYASYLGGSQAQEHVDGGTSRFDKNGIVYQSVCGGCGGYSDFPTSPGAWSSQNLSSNCNNLIFKFDFEIVPVADFTVDQFEGCAPLTITFSNESGGSEDYEWDFGNGDQTSVANPVRTFTNPGTYEVVLSVTDSVCNLTDTAIKVVTVHPQLDLSVSNDTVLCNSASFDLVADSDGTANNFTWSSDPSFNNILNTNGDSIISITPSQPGYYYAQVSNQWCDEMDSVFVDFVGASINVSPDTSMCKGDSLTLFATNNNPNISVNYNWFPSDAIIGSNSTSSVIASPKSSRYIYVYAQASNGCTILDSVYVGVTDLPQAEVFASADPDTIANGGSTVLTAYPENADHYLWIPTFESSDPNSLSVEVSPNEDKTYTVFLTKDGCERAAKTTVYVEEFVCERPFIFVPNAFTPNGDGRNDQVFVRGQNLKKLEFKIYDRWGEKIFETNEQSKGWDGTFKDKNMDPDVYVYYLSGTCVGGEEFFEKGDITLIR